MPCLIGGAVASQFGRISSGLAAGNGIYDGSIEPMALQVLPSRLAPTDIRATHGHFRHHLNGLTTDILNAPLGLATVLIYDWPTKLLVAELTSDASGYYDYPVYGFGTTYFIYTNKAGSPEVFGASSNQVQPS